MKNTMQDASVNRIVQLLLTQESKGLTEEEELELAAWRNASVGNTAFVDRCQDREQVSSSLSSMDAVDDEVPWRRFLEKNAISSTHLMLSHRKYRLWMAAAITVGILATVSFLFLGKPRKQARPHQPIVNQENEITPGSRKATLTLGDGRIIKLNEAKDGQVSQEDGAVVNKQGDALEYLPEGNKGEAEGKKAPTRYHAVSTPTGGFYALTLPDKSKVWLNAESSIHFPTTFTGKERRVETRGEAYFEVLKDTSHPFIVSTGNMEIKVLGTHFNVRNYTDEHFIKATLLEGGVRVSAARSPQSTIILAPGQQAILPSTLPPNIPFAIPVQPVDLEGIVAWKNGYFDFKAVSMTEMLQEIKRWYAGIDTIEMKVPVSGRFTAAIPRNMSLSSLLNVLQEMSKAHFGVRGKTIVVTP